MVYIEGDAHELIKTLPDNSIDLLYTNPPFGTTQNVWDQPLRWKSLWPEIWRVMKPRGTVVLHCAIPFTYTLIKSQTPKYHYSILKNNKTGFLGSRFQPLRQCEELCVFYKKHGTYNAQKIPCKPRTYGRAGQTSYYGAMKGPRGKEKKTVTEMHPTTHLTMKINVRGGKTVSDEMVDFVTKTYSNEGDTVLDMTTCNKVVGNRVELLGRKFIGFDLNFMFPLDGSSDEDSWEACVEAHEKCKAAADLADRNVDQPSDSDTPSHLLES